VPLPARLNKVYHVASGLAAVLNLYTNDDERRLFSGREIEQILTVYFRDRRSAFFDVQNPAVCVLIDTELEEVFGMRAVTREQLPYLIINQLRIPFTHLPTAVQHPEFPTLNHKGTAPSAPPLTPRDEVTSSATSLGSQLSLGSLSLVASAESSALNEENQSESSTESAQTSQPATSSETVPTE